MNRKAYMKAARSAFKTFIDSVPDDIGAATIDVSKGFEATMITDGGIEVTMMVPTGARELHLSYRPAAKGV